MAQVLAHLDLDAIEAHLRHARLLVAPDQRRLVDAETGLREQPFGEGALAGAGLVERLVAEIDEAVGAAAKRELRMVEVDVLEDGLHGEKRPPRERHLGALERQGDLAVAVGDLEALERNARPHALPRAREAACRDVHSGGLRDRGDDVLAVLVDVGQRDVAQPKRHQGEGDEEERRDARSQAKDDAR